MLKMITHKKKEIEDRINKINEYRRVKYKKPPEETNSIYMIFREVKEGQVPSTLYVGKTKKDLATRLSQHINEINRAIDGKIEWTVKLTWMYQVIKEHGALKIALLNKVPANKSYEFEDEWITYLGLAGFKMLNGNNSNYYTKIDNGRCSLY